MPYTLGTAKIQLETHFVDATAWNLQKQGSKDVIGNPAHLYIFCGRRQRAGS